MLCIRYKRPANSRFLVFSVFWLFLVSTFLLSVVHADDSEHTQLQGVSLDQILQKVKANNLGLQRFLLEAEASTSDAAASEYLPDPVVFAGVQSLPTDTFDLDQEPMTQLRFGIRQMFPKGESLALMQDMGKLNSSLQSAAQMNHWLQLKKATEQTWYEAWYWHKNIALIAEDRVFLVQMLDFIQSLYQVGVKDQSDLIGAQLELIRLDERQIDAKRNYEKFHYELNALANETLPAIAWEEDLPEIVNTQRFLIDKEQLLISLSTHPKVKMLDEKLNLSSVKIDLVKQDFEPAWGVEVSYGLRDGDNMDGSDRANFLSAGVSVQVPLFTQGKQNHQLQGAKQRQTAAVLERDEMLRNSYFEYQNLYQQYLNTAEQRRLYEQDILPTLSKQKASAMQSYESDEGDFRLVSELYRKEQGARIMYQRLRVNELKLVSSMIYWLAEGTTHLNGVNAE